MKDTLCIGGGHSHHRFGVNLVGFHAIIFTVYIIIIYIVKNGELGELSFGLNRRRCLDTPV